MWACPPASAATTTTVSVAIVSATMSRVSHADFWMPR